MGGTLSGNTTQPAVNTMQPAIKTTQPAVQPAAPTVLPSPTQPSVYDMSANAYQGALGATGAAMSGQGVQSAMNPYISQVTQRTLGDLERQRQMQSMTAAAQAQKAGAFGGARHGVADSLTNEAFARQAANTAANLNMQGYNTAQSALMQGAAQLGSLSNLGFGFGQKIAQQQSGQGALQQALIQQLINAAQAQYSGFTGAPNAALQLPLAAVGAGNMGQQTNTTSKQPGLLDFAALAATAYASDRRLKTDVQPTGTRGGVRYYTWQWNDRAREIGVDHHPTHGVMADEVAKTHPHLVARAPDGYLRVNYGGL